MRTADSLRQPIDITPTWESVSVMMAETYRRSASAEALTVIKNLGKLADFLNGLALNDDGSLTLGSDDVKKLTVILK